MAYSNPTGLTSVTGCFSSNVDFSAIPPAVLQNAAERGSRVHTAIAKHLAGEYCVIEDDIAGYYEAAMLFLKRSVEDIFFFETRLTCHTFGFTGQVDLGCRLRGDKEGTIIDWKTSVATSKSWELQTSAYMYLAKEAYPECWFKRAMTVQLSSSKNFTVKEYTATKKNLSIFLAALTVTNFFGVKHAEIDWENL